MTGEWRCTICGAILPPKQCPKCFAEAPPPLVEAEHCEINCQEISVLEADIATLKAQLAEAKAKHLEAVDSVRDTFREKAIFYLNSTTDNIILINDFSKAIKQALKGEGG